ncbi:MAG: phosphoenolpyruvate synthase [Patescibacteria group bacterium]
MDKKDKNVITLLEATSEDVNLVGGKNASLGEMITELVPKGVNVPGGFAVTATGYWKYIEENGFKEELEEIFANLDPQDIKSIQKTGKKGRKLIMNGEFPEELKEDILSAYKDMCKKYDKKGVDVAVRSSAVCEDAPDASFAGQFETFLNVSGEKKLLKKIKDCFASAFNDRVISYRDEKNVPHLEFAVSVGVQKMVRSDKASSGIMFTLDTETGFDNAVLINSIWGLGEMIVQGGITPDEFYVFKPSIDKEGKNPIIRKDLGRKTKKYIYKKTGGLLEKKVSKEKQLEFSLTDEEIQTLAKWATVIEEHYGRPQDLEWAKDGETGELFIVQSRPETVHAPDEKSTYKEYHVNTEKEPIVTGIAVGSKIGQGKVKVIKDVKNINKFEKGDVLVTEMTDPDWVSVMRNASAIVTDEGGKTAHASIVGRELGVPTIVGSEDATEKLSTGDEVTIDCTQGSTGRVYEGKVDYEVEEHDLGQIPDLNTKVLMNIGTPETAFKHSFLPNDGVGLARMEFILANHVKVHPLALYNFEDIEDKKLKEKIAEITVEHEDKKEHFIKELAEGVAQIAAAFYPKPVLVRLSDFKSNEYKNLVGGELYENDESNPMLGFRGASRYTDKDFQPAFEMECEAMKRVRETFGLDNVNLMVPFCRKPEEGDQVLKIMADYGLTRDNLDIYVMAEIPSNVVLVNDFADRFDGFSIGSNDLTQLTLGVDRDNGKLKDLFNENDKAVRKTIEKFLWEAHERHKPVGICGEAPATTEGFVEFLVNCGIDTISVNPEAIIKTYQEIEKHEN